jgi:deoxyribodipyrimidine photo-lyase
MLAHLRETQPEVAVLPVFIWSPETEGDWPPGAASRWWLHQNLNALSEDLSRLGSRLILREGRPEAVLAELVRETGAHCVYFDRRIEPAARQQELDVSAALRSLGVETAGFLAHLLLEPDEIRNQSGKPYQVFTQYWKRCVAMMQVEPPFEKSDSLPVPEHWPESLPLAALSLLPTIPWDTGMRAVWQPGEAGAERELGRFVEQFLHRYDQSRNLPAQPGTSRLSPYLHWGVISPRQVWQRVKTSVPGAAEGPETYLKELGWREFAYHLLFHFPHTAERCLRAEYETFPWQPDARLLRAWQRGRTGFPIVDAGLRELWTTGWMHNRVRMIAASLLVKHLLQPWQEGSKWFWDTLIDADLASNSLGWQWVAGCGADASPYFRVFNPVLQGEKFDPTGEYIRRWVPEIAGLPNKWIHRPWEAPPLLLRDAGLDLGKSYPEPIIAHETGRERALAAFQQHRAGSR